MVAGSKVAAKEEKSIVVVFVFVVQCLTQHTARALVGGVGGGCCFRFVLVVLASRVRPVPFRSR